MPEEHRRALSLRIRGQVLPLGSRTLVMGILNVTPDSFSGDGLLDGARDHLRLAVAQAERMAQEGADLLDVGGESTRPGHRPVDEPAELGRVIEVIRALRARLPEMPISVDTGKPGVAAAALDAGADCINDVTATTSGPQLAQLAARRGVPYLLMHGSRVPPDADVAARVIADLAAALERARAAGCAPDNLLVDPGIGFGKTAEQNLALLRDLGALRQLGTAIVLGTSRKSTIGKVLDLPVDERLEGTLATTALGIAAGVDIVRVHDVQANVRVARMCDAIVRGGWHDAEVRTGG
jgi:dihydropteroate synthase